MKEEGEKVDLKLNIQKKKIMASSPITSWEIDGEIVETVTDFIFWGVLKSLQMVIACMKLKKRLLLGRKIMTNLDSILKSRDVTLPIQVCISQGYDFSSSQVQVWELVHKEGWAPKNWFFWTVVLEKTIESPLDCKEIKPVNPERN